mmetsp:Transcript_48802/g.110753  ORF Transcript_48802/g.110753 Transcript_48802/m.110753 type:complete len:293 (-) Transcript_48802:318-1196(-)
MDLLLISDNVGGALKNGGIRRLRFVKPGRRNRGTREEDSSLQNDTYLSSVGSRMLMGAEFEDAGITAEAPIRKRSTCNQITATSADQNPQLLIHTAPPKPNHDNESSRSRETPLPSCRTLYNQRVEKEVRTVAGRAGIEHLGGGNAVLIECTPRSARIENGRGSGVYYRITKKQTRLGYKSLGPVNEDAAVRGEPADERLTGRQVESARLDSQRTERTERTERTGRSSCASTSRSVRSAALESERAKLTQELEALDAHLGSIEGVLETKSSQSSRSARSQMYSSRKNTAGVF